MKNLRILILVLLASISLFSYSQTPTSVCRGTRIVITPWSDGGLYFSGKPGGFNYMAVNPGDTLVLKAGFNTWSYFSMEDVHGTPSCPVVVINEGGQVQLTKGFDFRHCSDIKLTGSGTSTFYGFQVYNPSDFDNNGVAIGIQGRSKNIEVERIDVHKKTYGAWIKQDPGCIDSINYPNWHMDNIKFHDSKFLNIGQDCIYAGNTDPGGYRPVYCNGVETHPIPMRLSNIQIYNLIIDSCNRTGIQLSGCDSGYNAIYNNVIIRCGFELNQQQGTGISIGGMTKNCHVYNNKISQTFLYGIMGLGCGTNYIENNKIDSSGYLGSIFNSYSQPSNIYIDTRPGIPFDSAKYVITGNSMGLTASYNQDNIFFEKSYDTYAAGSNLCSNIIKNTGASAKITVRPGIDWSSCGVSVLCKTIPGKVEAEDWATMNGVQTEGTSDVGGGLNVGWIDNGDWMDYKLIALTGGSYTIKFQVASPNNGSQFQLRKEDGTVLSTINVPNTGGWQAWTTVSATVQLPAGTQTIRVISTSTPNWNINWMDFSLSTTANIPPVVNAGADMTITLPVNTIQLNGTASDADGSISTYLWTQIAGPSNSTIVSPSQAQTQLSGLVQGIYKYELAVTDNAGSVVKDTVQLTVLAAPNQAPIAKAGTSLFLILPVNTTQLNGAGTDTDGKIVSYLWTKVSGPSSFAITNAQQAQTTVSNLVQGVYKLQLTVTDNAGATGVDTLTLTVNPAPNQPPVANAGADQTIALPLNSVQLSGSGNDADGSVVSYQWTMISGPVSFTIASASQAQTLISGLIQGSYLFELMVVDNNGATARDTVSVKVNPAPNMAPTVKAGDDKIITLPTNTLTVNGIATDADGVIVSYTWSKVAGPSQSTIVNPAQATTNINSLVQGTYQFELKAVDNAGAAARDTVTITVNPAPNVAPIASAGGTATVTLPVNSVVANGSGSDPDGYIVGYQWTKVSGPDQYTISNAAAAQATFGNLVQGTYKFELKVTDNNGAVGRDTFQIIENAAILATKPTAYAGADQTIILPANSIVLSGSGTAYNATIVGYQWTKVSGSAVSIVSPTSAQTTVKSLSQGNYAFELKVTDSKGTIGRDTMIVKVVKNTKSGAAAKASVYPTVTESTLNVQVNDGLDINTAAIQIFNMNGVLVQKEEFQRNHSVWQKQVNVSRLSPGAYFIVVNPGTDAPITLKFIKQ